MDTLRVLRSINDKTMPRNTKNKSRYIKLFFQF